MRPNKFVPGFMRGSAVAHQKNFGGRVVMRLFRSVLLGSGTLLFATPVFAADVDKIVAAPALREAAAAPAIAREPFEPTPPPPDCSKKKGYYVVAGTNTCLKIIGLIRAQAYLHDGTIAGDHWTSDEIGAIAGHGTTNDPLTMGANARLGVDTLTDTPYGALRGNITLSAGGYAEGDTGVAMRYAFITLSTIKDGSGRMITAGHTDSFFTGDGALGGLGGAIGDFGGGRRAILGYSTPLTKQLTASISLEDHDAADGAKDNEPPLLSTSPVLNNGTTLPDLVGNLVGEFDWGLLFVAGALGHYRVITNNTAAEKYDFMGWAFGGGGNVKLDMLGKGDKIQAKIGYTDGAGNYLGSADDLALIDTVAPDTGPLLTSGWAMQGSFMHNWNPTLSSVVYTGLISADRHPSGDASVIELTYGKVDSAWNAGANLLWKPSEGFAVGGEVFYGSVTKQNSTGTGEETNGSLGSVFRVERSF